MISDREFEDLKAQVHAGLAGSLVVVGEKLGGLEGSVVELGGRLDRVEGDVARLDGEADLGIGGLEHRVAALERLVADLGDTVRDAIVAGGEIVDVPIVDEAL